MADFINPYHFVPIAAPPAADGMPRDSNRWLPHATHDRYVPGTCSGTIRCTLTTETPTVVGAARTPAANGQPSDVATYTDPDGQPAIPASTLRGMIGALYEAATNSALRVLTDELYSVRVPAEPGFPLPKLGVLVSAAGKDAENGWVWMIRDLPLGFRAQGCARVRGYEAVGRSAPDTLTPVPGSFLADAALRSTSADNPHPWYLEAGFDRSAPLPVQTPSTGSGPDRPPPGYLRVLGTDHGRRPMPPKRKTELLVPIPPTHTEHPMPSEVLDRFHELADQRTVENPELPYQVQGAARNNDPAQYGDKLRLRPGDLVFYRVESGKVTELAVSQIWRRAVGRSFEYFRAVSKELLPFAPERETVTLAEQVFGFVENLGKGLEKGRQGKTLASRVRFADARLAPGQAPPFFRYKDAIPEQFTLQELSTPKPPCPALYFTPADGRNTTQLIPKTDLKPEKHRPHGRKFYVHHAGDLAPKTGKPPWETRDTDADASMRKSRVTPLRTNLAFTFRIDFDNLTDQELGFLLYALRPTEPFRHHVGMGKPLGLGRVRIDLSTVELVDRVKRYGSDNPLTAARHHETHSAGSRFVARLCDLVRGRADLSAQREAIEQLGDPANTPAGVRVHYPQVAEKTWGTTPFEQELYEWFVANEKRKYGQALRPLTGSGSLPELTPHPKHKRD